MEHYFKNQGFNAMVVVDFWSILGGDGDHWFVNDELMNKNLWLKHKLLIMIINMLEIQLGWLQHHGI